jgi:hypothetical protein
MSMMEEPPREERKGVVVQMWLVSLGIAVFCCAIFSALIAFYVGDLGKTLLSIDTRLANLEIKPPVATPLATMPMPVPVPAPSSALDAPTAAPTVTTPVVVTPAPEIVPPSAPAPVPEATAPVVAPSGSAADQIPAAAPATGAPEPIATPPAAEPGPAGGTNP